MSDQESGGTRKTRKAASSTNLEQADVDALFGAPAAGAEQAEPEAPDFQELPGTAHAATPEVPITALLDLSLPVSIELGRTTMTVQELLRLGRGAVVQLDRLAGEPVDIYVGTRRFAEGEVVVLGEHFGVRITRIVSRVSVQDAA